MELKNIRGIGSIYEKKLNEAGIKSIEELAISDIKNLSEKTGIKIDKIKKWKEEAKNLVGVRKAEIVEDISKISFIEIGEKNARVKIKEFWHNAPLYKGNFEEIKEKIEKENIAVYLNKKAILWFNGKWYENIPFKKKKLFMRWRK